MLQIVGSPPRMRGKPLTENVNALTIGITPADAGKTTLILKQVGGDGDHPRGCGENGDLWEQYEKTKGSPPRMRGKPAMPCLTFIMLGITPADAGKTPRNLSPSPCTRDHPRGCGENRDGRLHAGTENGSPPRMRGKRSRCAGRKRSGRITPADAGKTGRVRCCYVFDRDHPRGCGENSVIPDHIAVRRGSPPRMRGKPQRHQNMQHMYRITPADAGKTETKQMVRTGT